MVAPDPKRTFGVRPWTFRASNGDSAYVMVPVILRLQAGSKPLSAAGQIAFVMTRTENGWKIASWTYSASEPKLDR
jgi:ketosteroid isomerase-like protein